MSDLQLDVRDLHGHYDQSHVLHGMTFGVRAGEVVSLLGRNGAGKTTALRAVMGLLRKRSGSIRFEGRELVGASPEHVARSGIALCPEERAIFSSLSVYENLMLPPRVRAGGMNLEEIFILFPNLRNRLATQGTRLSGGEQQMLAIARILRTGATLLMLDEPSEGLAPVIVQEIARTILTLKQRGVSILLVEQNVRFAAGVSDRHYLVENGRVVDQLTQHELRNDTGRIAACLGV